MPATKRSGFLGVLVRAALPVGILAAGCVAYSILSVEPEEEKSPPVEEQVIRTTVTELRVRDYPVVIKTNGVVQAHNEVALNAQVSGQITNVSPAFEVGSYFSKGDVLVELDARDYKTALAVAQARFLGAWSALKLAAVNLKRSTTLFRMSYASEAAVNQATAAHEQASAELDAATAQVERAKRDLERTKIRAPFDGRVRQKVVGLGQSVGSGTPFGVVFAVDFAEVRLPIAARELQYLDLPELPDDSPVEVELRDAISEASETVWKAKIVRTEGALDEDSLELFAIARVDDPFGRKSGHPPLRIGQPVVGSIVGKVLNNVVALPRGAVRQVDQVFLVDKTELTLIAKTIIPIWSTEEHVIVRDPLIGDGALLSTTRLVYAPDGAKVEIIPDIEVSEATAKTNASSKAEPVAN
jgi:RND family efflux transporter MFP subunit